MGEIAARTLFSNDTGPLAGTGLDTLAKNQGAILELEGAQAPQSKTITDGSISPTAAYVIVDTEGSAAADDLDVISPVLSASENLHDGMVVYLKAADSGRVVTVKNSGSANGINTYDGNDYVLSTTHWLKLQLRSGKWYEIEGRAMETALSAATAAASANTAASNAATAAGDASTAASAAQTDATAAKTTSKHNKIYNGALSVDQERAGASVTPAASAYVCDNLYLAITQASKLTAQRVSASLAGAPYSEKFTIASAYTVGANDYFAAQRFVEGFDCADLLWGTAAAKTVTLSFLVKVSVAGTYSFALKNAAGTYSYVFTKALSAGEQYVTQTVPGCTSGVWPIDTSKSLVLSFDLGSGTSKRTGTTGSWLGGDYYGATGAVSLVATNGATYELGQTQLEAGNYATQFETVPQQQNIDLCRRYYQNDFVNWQRYAFGGNQIIITHQNDVQMRTTPSISLFGVNSGNMTGITASASNDFGVQLAAMMTSSSMGYFNATVIKDARM